jgi:integrase
MAAKKHPEEKEGKKKGDLWEKTPTPNLIKYVPKGTYYLRARFGGQPVRESLKTDNYRAARARLADRMTELRGACVHGTGAPETVLDTLRIVRKRIEQSPSVKASTRKTHMATLDSMEPGKPAAVPEERLSRLNEGHLRDWWAKVAAHYAPQRANHIFMFLRRAVEIGRKAGVVRGNPFEHLHRVKIPRTRLNIVSADKFREIIGSIRDRKHRHSNEAANWIEFMAYCGLRPIEVSALRWRDIDEVNAVITVYGGEEGPKNRAFRLVPMIPPMIELVQRMRREAAPGDPVFHLKKPYTALWNACDRVGIPRLRIYDCRHLFASTCVDSGVDIPLLSKWLGHRDGGALAMKTYIHQRDEHSQRSAAKVTFL